MWYQFMKKEALSVYYLRKEFCYYIMVFWTLTWKEFISAEEQKSDAVFSTNQELNKHTEAVHERKRHRCELCDIDFSLKNSVRNNISTFHERHFNALTKLVSLKITIWKIMCRVCTWRRKTIFTKGALKITHWISAWRKEAISLYNLQSHVHCCFETSVGELSKHTIK